MTGEPVHYRFVTTSWSHVQALLVRFRVIRETPRGYWVVEEYFANFPAEVQEKERRWVSKDSRKRFCYPSKEQAWASYKERCRWRVIHLERQLATARAAVELSSPEDRRPVPGRLAEKLFL